jgi:hypothetical protein
MVAIGALVVVGLVFVIIRTHQTAVRSAVYPTIDGIPCQSSDQTGMHIHAHVTIYINGKRVPIPADIGIAPDGSCGYWIHTHDASGIIHIEAPADSAFVLGNFLDIWSGQFRQRGYPSQLADPAGWQMYLGGKHVTGAMGSIPLQRHALITLTYNSPQAPPDTSYDWGDY